VAKAVVDPDVPKPTHDPAMGRTVRARSMSPSSKSSITASGDAGANCPGPRNGMSGQCDGTLIRLSDGSQAASASRPRPQAITTGMCM
jgi:hypothetical protein